MRLRTTTSRLFSPVSSVVAPGEREVSKTWTSRATCGSGHDLAGAGPELWSIESTGRLCQPPVPPSCTFLETVLLGTAFLWFPVWSSVSCKWMFNSESQSSRHFPTSQCCSLKCYLTEISIKKNSLVSHTKKENSPVCMAVIYLPASTGLLLRHRHCSWLREFNHEQNTIGLLSLSSIFYYLSHAWGVGVMEKTDPLVGSSSEQGISPAVFRRARSKTAHSSVAPAEGAGWKRPSPGWPGTVAKSITWGLHRKE